MRPGSLVLLTALAVASCGGQGGSPAPEVLSTLAPGEAREVSCRYRVTVERPGAAPESWDWYFARVADRVETRETRGDTGEVWFRGKAGTTTGHERVFHADRRVVEFHAGDLAALGAERRWDLLSSVIDPGLLGTALLPTGKAVVAGRPADTYAGEIRGSAFEVTWVPSWRIPSRLRKGEPGETLTFVLAEIHAPSGAPWARIDASAYERIDFADIGDRHTDPFCRRFDRNFGVAWPGGHAHGDGGDGHE